MYVPFKGDGELFQLRPNTYDFNPPRATIDGTVLVFSITGRALEKEQVQREIDTRLVAIERYLTNLIPNVDAHSNDLKWVVPEELQARAAKLKSDSDLVGGLGFKVRGKN